MIIHLLSLYIGKLNWDNKSVIRAINAEKFKKWRPFIYEEIRGNYAALSGIQSTSKNPAFPGNYS